MKNDVNKTARAGIIKHTVNSFTSSTLDVVLFYLFMRFVYFGFGSAELLATASARVISTAFNFAVSRRFVFRSDASVGSTLPKYLTVAAIQMALSAMLVFVISRLATGGDPSAATFIKIPVDISLFFLGYFLQKKWVFAAPHEKCRKTSKEVKI